MGTASKNPTGSELALLTTTKSRWRIVPKLPIRFLYKSVSHITLYFVPPVLHHLTYRSSKAFLRDCSYGTISRSPLANLLTFFRRFLKSPPSRRDRASLS